MAKVDLQIESARASVAKQFILITPQDMGNVAMGPDIRVHRYLSRCVCSNIILGCEILSVVNGLLGRRSPQGLNPPLNLWFIVALTS